MKESLVESAPESRLRPGVVCDFDNSEGVGGYDAAQREHITNSKYPYASVTRCQNTRDRYGKIPSTKLYAFHWVILSAFDLEHQPTIVLHRDQSLSRGVCVHLHKSQTFESGLSWLTMDDCLM